MAVKVNFADTEDQRTFEPVPPANYNAMITNVKVGEVKSGNSKGATRINWEFTLDTEDEYNGRKVFDGQNMVQSQLWKPKAMLKACGFEIPDDEFEFEPEDVVGSELVIKVGVQPKSKGPDGTEYDARNNVKAFYPADEDPLG